MLGRFASWCTAFALACAACTAPDPKRYLDTELAFLRTGVQPEEEEREVRRVLAQRGMRVVARVASPGFIALGAATRDGQKSAVRVITTRGVAHAEDASRDDLFHPGSVTLIEHFGGRVGDYVLMASARIPLGRELGCVTLARIVADGRVVECQLDLNVFGSHACVANVAPGGRGRVRATVAWPALHALTTPTLEAELELVETKLGEPPPLVPTLRVARDGDWIERERERLATVRLARAPFSLRHATGVARAALGALTGVERDAQLGAYRAAVQAVPPGSPEAEVVAATAEHIANAWFDPEVEAERARVRQAAGAEGQGGEADPSKPSEIPEDAIIVEPERSEGEVPADVLLEPTPEDAE